MVDDPIPLSDSSLRALTGYLLQRATTTAMLRYKAVFAEHGLRRTTFSCLSLIVENPGLRQSQLADCLSIERPNLVQIIEELFQAGLVRREKCPTDRRAHALTATDAGHTRMQQAMAAIQTLDQEITSTMTKDRINAMCDGLNQIEKTAAAIPLPGAAPKS